LSKFVEICWTQDSDGSSCVGEDERVFWSRGRRKKRRQRHWEVHRLSGQGWSRGEKGKV
jgi:hypothetical protein